MNANRALPLVLLVIGAILLFLGLSAGESFASEVKEAFTGEPTNRAIWLTIGGAVLAVVGLVGLLSGSRRPAV
jgi:hypothetical protein